jgi:ABC-type uncharacterized transport system fused permease/ATPase subunit
MKGRLRGYIERLQNHAQCIVLYRSERVELKYLKQLISTVCKSILSGSISLTLINFPMQLSGKKKKSSSRFHSNQISKTSSSTSQWIVHIHYALGSILLYSKKPKCRTRPKAFK